MSNYKETEVTGTTYVRCNFIEIQNPINQTPTVSFSEESVVVLGEDKILTIPISQPLHVTFDPMKSISVIDPETLLPTGETVLMAEIYVLLFSAYIAEATARDAAGHVVA